MFRSFYLVVILGLMSGLLQAQDSIRKKTNFIIDRDSATLFGSKGIIEGVRDEPHILIGGLVSTYYALYSDQTIQNGFVQIPTMAPRNNQVGLNMALVNMEYGTKNARGKLGIHYGDIPSADWPSQFNLIQEANGGCRLYKGLWLDAGFFRSHIGVESIQPRENITSSMSMPDNFEPYCLAGAKLTYVFSSKLSLQLNTFNSFNSLVDYNKNKLFGFSAVYVPNSKVTFCYNFLTGDETTDTVRLKHQRYYNNFYATFKHKKFVLAAEANYGWQEHSKRGDTTKSAAILSGLIVARYQLLKKLAVYARSEYFSDPDMVLTGSHDFGKSIMGTTGGIEFKPHNNISLSVESRILQSDNYVFKEGDFHTNQRYEFIICLDISF